MLGYFKRKGSVLYMEVRPQMMKFSRNEVDEIQRYLLNLFPQQENCYIKIFNKKTKEFKFYPIQIFREASMLKNILNYFGKEDLMISANTFKTMERATEGNLFSINTLCVDVDYKKLDWCKDLTPEAVIKFLELDYFDIKIPKPNYIEYSNQLRLIYVLSEPVYLPKRSVQARTLCNRISEQFAEVLRAEFHSELQKVEKFIRVPYGVNTKGFQPVQILAYNNSKYPLKDLQDFWLDELPEWYTKWKSNQNKKEKKVPKHNILKFNQKRLTDFKKIQDYLNRTNEIDLRHRLCFLYHNYSLLVYKESNELKGVSIYDKAIEDMIEFNNNFNYPLINKQIISDTKFLRHKQYIYSNKSLMEFLELTEDKCLDLGLESIFESKSKELINKEYYNENKDKIKVYKKQHYQKNKKDISDYKKQKYQEKLKQDGKLSKKEEKEILKQKIISLKTQGLLNKEIAFDLKISIKTVERYITQLKKEGLLQ